MGRRPFGYLLYGFEVKNDARVEELYEENDKLAGVMIKDFDSRAGLEQYGMDGEFGYVVFSRKAEASMFEWINRLDDFDLDITPEDDKLLDEIQEKFGFESVHDEYEWILMASYF